MSLVIENVDIHGWEAAIRGARNPMNSWDKSDSWFDFTDWYESDGDRDCGIETSCAHNILGEESESWTWGCPLEGRWCESEWEHETMILGPNDHKLLMKLCKGGTEESKWRRFVNVSLDITAPLYWWKEFETYKVGTVCNSCSTMHKIQAKEFTLKDFSCEHLIAGNEFGDTPDELWQAGAFRVEHDYDPYALDTEGIEGWYEAKYAKDILLETIDALNTYREKFIETGDKKYWYQMIQLLPSSYNQRRTIGLNYEVLAKQYRERKNHKLQEWLDYCSFIKSLPYSEFITMEN